MTAPMFAMSIGWLATIIAYLDAVNRATNRDEKPRDIFIFIVMGATGVLLALITATSVIAHLRWIP